jgi:hypothetical protein
MAVGEKQAALASRRQAVKVGLASIAMMACRAPSPTPKPQPAIPNAVETKPILCLDQQAGALPSHSIAALADEIVHREPAEVLPYLCGRIDGGLGTNALAQALAMASARAVGPRPYLSVEFHALLSAGPCHQATKLFADRQVYLPLLWLAENLKAMQAQHIAKGNPSLQYIEIATAQHAGEALAELQDRLDRWDEGEVEGAALRAHFSAKGDEVWELFRRYAARDLRDIGHKSIAIANGWKAANGLSKREQAPIVQNIALSLLRHDSDQPLPSAILEPKFDVAPQNAAVLAQELPALAFDAPVQDDRVVHWLHMLRIHPVGDVESLACAELLRGLSPETLLAAINLAAAELVLRAPEEVVALHALTTAHAIRESLCLVREPKIANRLLLQSVTRVVSFRDYVAQRTTLSDDVLDRHFEAKPAPTFNAELPPSDLAKAYRDDPGLAAASLAHPSSRLQERFPALICNWMSHANDFHDVKLPIAALEASKLLPDRFRATYIAAALAHMRGRLEEECPAWTRAQRLLNGAKG